jgi:hypothetical protein
MQNIPNLNPIDAAIYTLSNNPPKFAKNLIKKNLIQNTRKAITIKVKADRKTAWTPELVVSRMHKDTDADVFVLFGLVGIGEAELLEIARGALEMLGFKCPPREARVVAVGAVAPEVPKGKEPGFITQCLGWVKNIFWSVKK